jgi:hypothetical protein
MDLKFTKKIWQKNSHIKENQFYVYNLPQRVDFYVYTCTQRAQGIKKYNKSKTQE